jgi:hypothetical protein
MTYGELRRLRGNRRIDERRPDVTRQDQRLLQSVHLKTIENRTLMETLKKHLPQEKLDEIIVDYAICLRKARKNFQENNLSKELDFIANELAIEEEVTTSA